VEVVVAVGRNERDFGAAAVAIAAGTDRRRMVRGAGAAAGDRGCRASDRSELYSTAVQEKKVWPKLDFRGFFHFILRLDYIKKVQAV
jgi:hypothetical protein